MQGIPLKILAGMRSFFKERWLALKEGDGNDFSTYLYRIQYEGNRLALQIFFNSSKTAFISCDRHSCSSFYAPLL